jgi:hypothetical protein
VGVARKSRSPSTPPRGDSARAIATMHDERSQIDALATALARRDVPTEAAARIARRIAGITRGESTALAEARARHQTALRSAALSAALAGIVGVAIASLGGGLVAILASLVAGIGAATLGFENYRRSNIRRPPRRLAAR